MRALKASDVPNVISALRLLVIVPIIYLLVARHYGWALALFAAAGISDGVDGFLAKHYGWQSAIGGILDPLADKALLTSCFLVLGAQGLIPLWLMLAVIFRDLVIVVGAVLYHYLVEDLRAAPTLVSKLNTVVQILLVVVVIADAGPIGLPRAPVDALIWMCLATTLVSGVSYVWIWGRLAVRNGGRHP